VCSWRAGVRGNMASTLMTSSRLRSAQRGLVVAAALAVLPASAAADPPSSELRASTNCEKPSGPGRFRCDVEVRVADGELQWADVEVVATADFILPLRGRLGPRDAASHERDIFRWSLGFVARTKGAGDVTARVRGVVCHGESCVPASVEVTSKVVVGP
jgi:hypothetical protein